MVLCFPDLGFYFSKWFYAFPIWDFIFPNGFVFFRFGILFFQVVLCFPDLGYHFFLSGFVLSQVGMQLCRERFKKG